ncbi:MAG: DNA cytosine methyltransferase, partial [Candidatus Saccharibacteria bacterium]
ADTWGVYTPAIARWESVFGHDVPAASEIGPKGGPRLSALFVEWMMGYEPGWVTGAPGLSRSAQIARLGNAVMPQQAAAALRLIEDFGA